MSAHFTARCAERLPGVDAQAVYNDLALAVHRLKGGVDMDGQYIEKVGCLPANKDGPPRDLFRFRVQCGIAFAIIAKNGTPITVVSQPMIKAYKRRVRARVIP